MMTMVSMKSIAIGLTLSAFLSAACSGPGDASGGGGHAGENVGGSGSGGGSANGVTISVLGSYLAPELDGYVPSGDFFLLVGVEVRNESQESASMSSTTFKLTTNEGLEFLAGYGSVDCRDDLLVGPGGSATCRPTFQPSPGATPSGVAYAYQELSASASIEQMPTAEACMPITAFEAMVPACNTCAASRCAEQTEGFSTVFLDQFGYCWGCYDQCRIGGGTTCDCLASCGTSSCEAVSTNFGTCLAVYCSSECGSS